MVDPLEVLDPNGYKTVFFTPTGERAHALPPSMEAGFLILRCIRLLPMNIMQQKRVRSILYQDWTIQPISRSGSRKDPILIPPIFGRDLEAYYNARDDAWKDLAQYDALLLPGGSRPMVDMVNNFRVHDLIFGFLSQGKLIAAECYCVTCLAFARDWTDRKSIIWGKHVTGHALEYDYKDGTGFLPSGALNFGPPFYPLELILRDAVGPDGQYHGGVGRTISTIFDYPFLTGRSTQDSRLVVN